MSGIAVASLYHSEMRIFVWGVLALTACGRIGFEPVGSSPDDMLALDAAPRPQIEPDLITCIPNQLCFIDCTGKESCNVDCGTASQCVVLCVPGQACSVQNCGLSCAIDCGDDTEPTTTNGETSCD